MICRHETVEPPTEMGVDMQVEKGAKAGGEAEVRIEVGALSIDVFARCRLGALQVWNEEWGEWEETVERG